MVRGLGLVVISTIFLALGNLACSSSRRMAAALRSPDIESRRAASRELSQCTKADKNTLGLLLVAFMDSDAEVRTHGVKGLGKQNPHADGVVPAIRLALNDSSAEVRRAAAVALSTMSPFPTAALPSLAEALVDEDSVLCAYISSAFADLGKLGVPVLVRSLKSDNVHLRKNAARTLGLIGKEARGALDNLEKLLYDQDETVRKAAVTSIDQIK